MDNSGQALLQNVAERIVRAYLLGTGASGVMLVDEARDRERLSGVDIVYNSGGDTTRVKVKPDTYFGTDPRKIADQDLVFYRGTADAYAFETISHHLTREPGWMFNSVADDLYYYFFVVAQAEEEIVALMGEPDDVFFSEIAIERDELHILPMQAVREWFEQAYERYMPRPVTIGAHSAWYRIIPITDITGAVPGVRKQGSIFASVARG